MLESQWIYTLISLVLGFWIGYKIASYLDRISFVELLQDLGVTENQLKLQLEQKLPTVEEPSLNLPELEIKIEQHGEQLFAFRKDNDQFLAQGQDRDSLIQSLTENLNNVRVIVDKDDGADFLLKP